MQTVERMFVFEVVARGNSKLLPKKYSILPIGSRFPCHIDMDLAPTRRRRKAGVVEPPLIQRLPPPFLGLFWFSLQLNCRPFLLHIRGEVLGAPDPETMSDEHGTGLAEIAAGINLWQTTNVEATEDAIVGLVLERAKRRSGEGSGSR
jgi:hypothetical protein